MNYFEQNKPVIAEWARRVANNESLDGLEIYVSAWGKSSSTQNPEWRIAPYRFAPKTVTINGYEVVAPISEKPKNGQAYYFFHESDRDFSCVSSWYGVMTDSRRFKFGIFTNAEDARRYGLALHGIDPNTPVEEL